MPARTKHSDSREGEVGTPEVVVSPLVVGHTGTIAITGAPADVEVTFTVAPPGGGTSEQTVRTDDNGGAEIEIVPDTVGELNVAVTHTAVISLGVATAEVEVGAPPPALALTSLDPAESDAGPPQRFTLLINGDGFDINTRASFGVFSEEEADEGLGEAGAPKWEMGTRYVSPTQLSLDIAGGQFPSPDPAVPVSVGKPDGTTAGPVTFAFNPVEEETDG